MFKQSTFAVLIAVLVCATLSSAGLTTFGKTKVLASNVHSTTEKPKDKIQDAEHVAKKIFRRQVQSSYEDLFDAQQINDYKDERYNGADEKDRIENFMHVDPEWLAEEVARIDHVPPPKYVYETTNEEFERKPVEISNTQQVQVPEQSEDDQIQRLFKAAEESKTSEEVNQERLRDLEAQIIPYSDNNDDDHSDEFEKANYIVSNKKSSEEIERRDAINEDEILNLVEFENHVNTDNDDRNIYKNMFYYIRK